jgi:hypothetical protein
VARRGQQSKGAAGDGTEERLAALERELAELRAATSATMRPAADGKSSPPANAVMRRGQHREAQPHPHPPPRTMPRPHPTRLGDAQREEATRALSRTPMSATPRLRKAPATPTPAKASTTRPSPGLPRKAVSELTRDEVAVSLLSRFGGATSPKARVG